MEPQPYFSVIIPTLNEEKYLPNLLSDLSRQIERDFEVIVVDGHSEDRTKERAFIFKSKLPFLTVIDSPKRNVSFQRNLGGKTAKGKYFLFVDADSRLPEFFLSGLVYRLAENPASAFTCWTGAESQTTTAKTIANIQNIFLETAKLLDSPAAVGALIGCTPAAFKAIGGFDPKIKFAEDTEFIRKAHQKGLTFKIYKDPQFIFSLRRFRKNGTLRQFQKYALLHLKYITGAKIDQEKEYPMGGHTFSTDQTTQNLIDKMIKTLDAGKKIPSIVKKIKALMTLTEEE